MGRFDVATDEPKVVAASGLRVKHVIRGISFSGAPTASGFDPADMVDSDISALVNAGWTLKNTHYVGTQPEGLSILYVFER